MNSTIQEQPEVHHETLFLKNKNNKRVQCVVYNLTPCHSGGQKYGGPQVKVSPNLDCSRPARATWCRPSQNITEEKNLKNLFLKIEFQYAL